MRTNERKVLIIRLWGIWWHSHTRKFIFAGRDVPNIKTAQNGAQSLARAYTKNKGIQTARAPPQVMRIWAGFFILL